MNKGLVKFIFKLLLLLFVIDLVFIVIVRIFGMYIYDEEYACYQQTHDYINYNNHKNSIIISGDSLAKSAVIPEQLDDNAYNISMAGSTAIEQYYILRKYLDNHEPPKAIVMLYFMGGYNTIDNYFWNRTVYFNTLSINEFREIIDTNLFPGNKNEVFAEFLQYKFCMPNKYYAAIKNSFFEDRHALNIDKYQKAQESRGQQYFGTDVEFAPNNVTIDNQEHFEILDIIDYYMNESIKLCQKYGIKVIIEQPPINLSTYANMKDGFKKEYIDYMRKLQQKYPNAIINDEYAVVSNDWLGDFSHLNQNGAIQFTKLLEKRYSEYFK